jgi:hypothetical protein
LFGQVRAVYCAENLSDKLPDALVLVGRAAMQLIADWLEKLGMSEYAKAYAENRIDFSPNLHCLSSVRT